MTRDYKDASVLAEFLVSRNPFTAADFINTVTGESSSINVNLQCWSEIIETSAKISVVPVATSNVKLFLKTIE